MRHLVVGIDGGASKTDVAVVTLDGELIGRRRGAGSCPHYVGVDESVRVVDELVTQAAAGGTVAYASACISGLDLAGEVDVYRRRLEHLSWARQGLMVDNDLFGLLRSGSENRNAVAVISGTGTNAVGVHENGTKARFLSLGALSGDWGGGQGLGRAALWHAARAMDLRGPATALSDKIDTVFEMGVAQLIEAIHLNRISELALSRLAPAVFAASDEGDAVAQHLVDRQADEVVAYVRACHRQLRYTAPVDVVLGGGILHARHDRLHARIARGVRQVLPDAVLLTPELAPVVGATLLALEAAGVHGSALARAAAALA